MRGKMFFSLMTFLSMLAILDTIRGHLGWSRMAKAL